LHPSRTVRRRIPDISGLLLATLAESPRFELLLPALDHVRLTRMSGDSFILFGFEDVAPISAVASDVPTGLVVSTRTPGSG
jgi:hypothetical protein